MIIPTRALGRVGRSFHVSLFGLFESLLPKKNKGKDDLRGTEAGVPN
jgi:hypothetical protein